MKSIGIASKVFALLPALGELVKAVVDAVDADGDAGAKVTPKEIMSIEAAGAAFLEKVLRVVKGPKGGE